ncbi:hypothetical protein BSKO_13344 [Bryopsis sp. KO-2023]|nr:hypothetical protein BSKO_13344 [Bryopsis sp. KO-2023]
MDQGDPASLEVLIRVRAVKERMQKLEEFESRELKRGQDLRAGLYFEGRQGPPVYVNSQIPTVPVLYRCLADTLLLKPPDRPVAVSGRYSVPVGYHPYLPRSYLSTDNGLRGGLGLNMGSYKEQRNNMSAVLSMRSARPTVRKTLGISSGKSLVGSVQSGGPGAPWGTTPRPGPGPLTSLLAGQNISRGNVGG